MCSNLVIPAGSKVLPHNPEKGFCRDRLRSFRYPLCLPSSYLITKIANHFVRFWGDDCPIVETQCNVISSSASCSRLRVMDISPCPPLVYTCCTHCIAKYAERGPMIRCGIRLGLEQRC